MNRRTSINKTSETIEETLLQFLQSVSKTEKISMSNLSKSPSNTPRFLEEMYKKTPTTPRYDPDGRNRSTSLSPYHQKDGFEESKLFNENSPNPQKKNIVESLLGMFKRNDGEKEDEEVTIINTTNITLSDLEFKKTLGKGHYGKVFLVYHKESVQEFAVKKINKRRILPVVTKLKEEILLLKRLNSPFLIKLHRVFEDNDNMFLLLDYSDGGELRRLLSKKKKFEENVNTFLLIFRKLNFIL